MVSAHAGKKLRIATGKENLGKVRNQTVTWGKLIEKLTTPQVDVHHTLSRYLALPLSEQSRLKNVGFFVGGHCDDGVRRINSVASRDVLCIDIDETGPALLADLASGLSDVAEWEFVLSTTRKHTPSSPRMRVVFPLSRAVDPDEYHALSRIVSMHIDVTMESVDPVSFRPTQLMYWPSVCSDGEFKGALNAGSLLDPDAVLSAFGDWRDHTKLPRSERDSSTFNPAGKKPEDPTTKEGVVGAFCRVYDVPAAIDTFLPDVYVDPKKSGQGVRYTYAGGTSHHGAIVYDDGRFLFSNHMHDPAAGHSVNAYDLVRVHLFSDDDKGVKEGTSPLRMPSAKRMAELLRDDQAVVSELRDSKYSFDVGDARPAVDDDGVFDDLNDDTQVIDAEDDVDWKSRLDVSEDGLIKPTIQNIALILINDQRFAGAAALNRFTDRVVYRNRLPVARIGFTEVPVKDAINGDPWSDLNDVYVRALLEARRGKDGVGYGMRVADRDLLGAVSVAAVKQAFHPVTDYLSGLTWDGVARLDTLFVDYLGCPDDRYHRDIARMTLVAGVARVFEPGCKWDYMPILEGGQGIRKSTFVETLGKGWFSEFQAEFDDRNKTIEAMQGCWVLEIPELQQFKKSDVTKIKEFLSMKSETARLAYARRPVTFNRQCIFIGTTNESHFLQDLTGNRRFWPVVCGVPEIDIDKLRGEINQVWAEAAAVYRDMRAVQPYGDLPLYLTDVGARDGALEMQANKRVESSEDILVSEITQWLTKPVRFEELAGLTALQVDQLSPFDDNLTLYKRTQTCSVEIAEKVLGLSRKELLKDRRTQIIIGNALHLLEGWCRSEKRNERYGGYGPQRMYRLAGDEDDIM